MSKSKVRIKLKAFEHKSLDTACAKIVETGKMGVVLVTAVTSLLNSI